MRLHFLSGGRLNMRQLPKAGLTADAIAVRQNLIDRFAPPTNSWNRDLAVRAMEEIGRLGRDGAEIIFGHDDQQWRELRTGEAFYE